LLFLSLKRLFGAFFLVLIGTGAALAQDRYDELVACELSAAGGRFTTDALCGTLSVTEDPSSDGTGQMVDLAFAVLPARNGQPLPDPVFFLAGGPGQAAKDVAPIMSRALRDIHRNRDLVFLDQRGTGGSNPLDCEFDQTEDALTNPDPDEAARQLLACAENWPADIRFYTTTDAASDMEQLRQHLGFEQINLIGGSYGTRLAQVYLKNYPGKVRAAVLDGVAPMRLALGAEHGPSLDRTLEAIIAHCQTDAACNNAFPNLDQAFDQLKREYDNWADGPEITVTHPRMGEAVELVFSRAVLATALRFLAYDPSSQMLLPYLIHEAATTGNPQRIASQALMITEQMSDALSIGLNFAVGCVEDFPRWPTDTNVESTLLGDSIGALYRAICPNLSVGVAPEGFSEPFTEDVPMLLLSGQLDPVTPPSYGDEVDALSINSRHLVAPGRGHIVITLPCMARIASEFIDQASSEDLDIACMDALGQEPYFTNLLGPTP